MSDENNSNQNNKDNDHHNDNGNDNDNPEDWEDASSESVDAQSQEYEKIRARFRTMRSKLESMSDSLFCSVYFRLSKKKASKLTFISSSFQVALVARTSLFIQQEAQIKYERKRTYPLSLSLSVHFLPLGGYPVLNLK